MTDKPILFSAAMIRALLDGRKTQTRRVLCAADPSDDAEEGYRDFPPPYVAFGAPVYENPEDGNVYRFRRTYAIGDRLWVREAWRTADAYDDLKPSELGGEEPISFEADASAETFGWPSPRAWGRYRHGRYMPRWASRLTLTVTDVRVQRVQEISEADAVAEGCQGHEAAAQAQIPNGFHLRRRRR